MRAAVTAGRGRSASAEQRSVQEERGAEHDKRAADRYAEASLGSEGQQDQQRQAKAHGQCPAVRHRSCRDIVDEAASKWDSNASGSASGAGTMPAWIIAIRSRCAISRSARRFAIASHSTATPAKSINEDTQHHLFFRAAPPSAPGCGPLTAITGTLDRGRHGIVSVARGDLAAGGETFPRGCNLILPADARRRSRADRAVSYG